MGRRGGLSGGGGNEGGAHRRPQVETRIGPGFLRGRLVELRPGDGFEPSSGTGRWELWRLEDMEWMGWCSIKGKAGGIFSVGLAITPGRGSAAGGYAAETYRLMCAYASKRLGATRVLAGVTNLAKASALEEAGFRLVDAVPSEHAKRRRGYGLKRFEWTPRNDP